MNEKILFVDDDPNVRRSLMRRQQNQFVVETAEGGAEGLELIQKRGPYAVVVADMRMPIMNGIQFLVRVKEAAPDTVRMMLTGNADLGTAIEAVNEGNIFRFLTKPCPVTTLAEALQAGIEQYRLILAERELLDKTLRGSIEVLSEILSMVNSAAFSRASRTSRIVNKIVAELQLPDPWEFEVAIRLSQIGCITLPEEILDKAYQHQLLSDDETAIYRSHPGIGRQLLAHIPRLEAVAHMIDRQHEPSATLIAPDSIRSEEDRIALGAQLLKLTLDFDEQTATGLSASEAVAILDQRDGVYNPYLLAVLRKLHQNGAATTETREATVDTLVIGMIIDQDIKAKNGLLLVHAGQEVTQPIMLRLHNFARRVGIVEPFRVRLHTTET